MERPWVKYGWVVYLFLGLLWLWVGLTQVFDPEALLDNEAQHILGTSLSELEASFPEATELVRFQFGVRPQRQLDRCSEKLVEAF